MTAKSQRAKPERLEARITQEQKELFQRAADLEGRTVTDFVISAVQQAAIKTVQQHEVLHLSRRDSELLAEALVNPPSPSPSLRVAVEQYKKITRPL
jgi:uncharacterized protein (DUF1778 family)